ncbi:MAG: PQQ-binding-like beta-propeller repeat protein, partial [Dehalococcoidia bacterium]
MGTVSGQVVVFNVNEEMELIGGTQAVWRFPPQGVEGSPGVYSAPVLEGDTLYIGEFRDDGRVYALDVETGVMRWQQSAEGRIVGAPVLAGELLLVGSEDGSLYAFQAEDGTRKWRFPTEGKVWSTPAVSGDTVYFGSMDHAIYAV